jgi:hypothetical protein
VVISGCFVEVFILLYCCIAVEGKKMSAGDRLLMVQSALEKRGVRDVKFFFKLGMSATPRSEVRSGVADFLDAYVKGRSSKVERIGDCAEQA